jgi:hypothetical protein
MAVSDDLRVVPVFISCEHRSARDERRFDGRPAARNGHGAFLGASGDGPQPPSDLQFAVISHSGSSCWIGLDAVGAVGVSR